MVRVVAKVLVVFSLLAGLGACYQTHSVVIPPERAQAIPGAEGNWVAADGSAPDVLTVAAKPGTNDYLVSSNSPDAQGEILTARGYPLQDGVYAVQVVNESALDEGVLLVFLRIDGDTLAVVTPGDDSALAAETGATLGQDGLLDGSVEAMQAFIDAHQGAAFGEAIPLLKRAP